MSHLTDPAGKRGTWAEHLQDNALHIALNFSGEGLVIGSETRLTLLPKTLAIFKLANNEATRVATRFQSPAGHDLLLLTISAEALGRLFPTPIPLLKRNLGVLRRWSSREEQFYQDLIRPPVASAARQPWFQAKILEILSLHLFHEPTPSQPLFCSELKQQTHRHVRQALELLQARLQEPLNLPGLALDVGCAPHYLSRLVKQNTGKTLSLHLRAFRAERAAELLASGRYSVTEVSMEVGYSSLSHFSKAFGEEHGCTPSAFLKRGA
ncbi:MAG: helix-turn-helix transcriptional regulator [Verrucomicrobiales bacterium]